MATAAREQTEGSDGAALLLIDDLAVSYATRTGDVPAVTGVSLKIAQGESLGLVGESGCGKTTVAMAIMRYFGHNGRIVRGRIRFAAEDIAVDGGAWIQGRRGGIAMVYQDPMSTLNPALTVGEQLAEVPVYVAGIDWYAARRRATEMLRAVRLPDVERVLAAYPHQLSGGQQQRVVIAMALLAEPALLVLDEPTTSLDVTVEAGVVELIAELRRRFGTTLLYISHNLGLIAHVCDRVAVMYAGEIVEDGRVGDVFARPRHPYTAGLLRCIPHPTATRAERPLRPIPGTVAMPQDRLPGCGFAPRCAHRVAGLCDVAPVPMAALPREAGRHVRCLRWQEWSEMTRPSDVAASEAEESEEIMLAVESLDKFYPIEERGVLARLRGKRRVVKANQDLTFRIRRKQTLAIVGESGCGKSTFAKVLMGLEDATEGKVHLGDIDLAHLPVQRRNERTIARLQMIFQNPFDTLNPSHSVGAQISRVIRKFGVERDPAKVEERMHRLLDIVKLPREFAKRRPRQLSGGQKQRVGIARAFAGDPKIVIADEPVSALDVSVQAAVTELLMDIQREHRTTLLFISHDLSVVRYLADRIVVMYLGQIMEKGTTEQIFSPPYHPYTEALLSAVPIADANVTKRKIVLTGELPSPSNPPKGCPFSTRCPYVIKGLCDVKAPPLREFQPRHVIACHLEKQTLLAMQPVITVTPSAEAVPAGSMQAGNGAGRQEAGAGSA